MGSQYLLMDTAHADYSGYQSDLQAASNPTYNPRLSLDTTQALVQVKEAVDTDSISWWASPSACITDSGDEGWAYTLVWAGWTAGSGNDWNSADS